MTSSSEIMMEMLLPQGGSMTIIFDLSVILWQVIRGQNASPLLFISSSASFPMESNVR